MKTDREKAIEYAIRICKGDDSIFQVVFDAFYIGHAYGYVDGWAAHEKLTKPLSEALPPSRPGGVE